MFVLKHSKHFGHFQHHITNKMERFQPFRCRFLSEEFALFFRLKANSKHEVSLSFGVAKWAINETLTMYVVRGNIVEQKGVRMF